MAPSLNVLLLAFPNGQLLDITGPLQMLAGANAEVSHQAYRIEIAAPDPGPLVTSSGVRLIADLSFAQVTSKRLDRTHTLLAAGGHPGMRAELARGGVTGIVSRSMAVIAHGCGFGSVRRMDRAFARTIAVSPTEFRARFRAHGEKSCKPSTSALLSSLI
jgi:transcriptional regulator GlxA family with amidase domain